MPIEDPTNNNPDVEVVRKRVEKHDPDWQSQDAKHSLGHPIEAGKKPQAATRGPFDKEQY
jgi:hypothetical protein